MIWCQRDDQGEVFVLRYDHGSIADSAIPDDLVCGVPLSDLANGDGVMPSAAQPCGQRGRKLGVDDEAHARPTTP
jgi:hypothetical protein